MKREPGPVAGTSGAAEGPTLPDPHKLHEERMEMLRRKVRAWLEKPRYASGRWPDKKQIDAAIEPLVKFIAELPPAAPPEQPCGNYIVVHDKALQKALIEAEKALARAIAEPAASEHIRARRQLINLRKALRLAAGVDPAHPPTPPAISGRKESSWKREKWLRNPSAPIDDQNRDAPAVRVWADTVHEILSTAMAERNLGTGKGERSVVAHFIHHLISHRYPAAGATPLAVADYLARRRDQD